MWTPDNLAVAGAKAAFMQALEVGETVYDKHSMLVPSETDTEAYVFPGFMPTPREFLNSRQFVGARDFRFNLQNKEYELSMIVNRKNWEDDQVGGINSRMSEMGEVWRDYHDDLFADMLENGDVAGSLGWDGATFYNDTRTIGDSGTIDNQMDVTAVTGTALTTNEFLEGVNDTRTRFLGFNDDRGRPFNRQAISELRIIVPPSRERVGFEAMNQTAFSGGSGATNQYGNKYIQGVDVLAYLTADLVTMYASALGSKRKAFMYQERTGLEIIMLTGGEEVAKNNGVMVLSRQRFVHAYGEPRRSIELTIV